MLTPLVNKDFISLIMLLNITYEMNGIFVGHCIDENFQSLFVCRLMKTFKAFLFVDG
jgi:hypothetical protein